MFFAFNILILLFSAGLFAALFATLAYYWLSRKQLVDVPNERSNHVKPVVRGGGIAVMGGIISFLFVCDIKSSILLMAVMLTAVSFRDDWKGLSVQLRLLVQIFAVGIGVSALEGNVFQGIFPWYIDKLIVGVIWLWILNLYNFMDGIDGITSVETISICAGLLALESIVDLHQAVPLASGILIGAMGAFLIWNWHPARMFLGDSGSIPLGFLVGYLLLHTAEFGYWQAVLILPAYYVTDATLTLLGRLLRGKKFWEAHSEHGYQKAVRRGRSHDFVATHILGINILLIMLAAISIINDYFGLIAIAIAYGLAFMLRSYFSVVSQTKHALPAAS